MDTLPQLGTEVMEVLGPTFSAYESLVLANEDKIKSTKRETHAYGPETRQALDVYYPDDGAATPAPFKAKPVLVFLYGGGFVDGDKIKPGYAHDLVFANIGHYFASRHGFTVIIPNYRLLKHGAVFPSGGQDVKLVIDWISTSLAQKPGYDAVDLFLLGNSVGGIHATTWAFHPDFTESVANVTATARTGPGVLLRGLMLLGAPIHFGGDDNEILRAYYGGGPDVIAKNIPLALAEAAKQRAGANLLPGVRIAQLLSELDPEYLYQSTKDLQDVWPNSEIETQIIKGHNHISPQCSLGTGIEKEEAWGIQVADFCRSRASS